jgi:hypothetical protein
LLKYLACRFFSIFRPPLTNILFLPTFGLTLNRWSIFGNHLDYTSLLFPVYFA